MNPSKSEKVRVVRDAVSKYQNISLKVKLLKGLDLLKSLVSILIKFRKGMYAVSGDRKISYQVKVKAGDRDALIFLWRDLQSDEISGVHIFGNIGSPSYSN